MPSNRQQPNSKASVHVTSPQPTCARNGRNEPFFFLPASSGGRGGSGSSSGVGGGGMGKEGRGGTEVGWGGGGVQGKGGKLRNGPFSMWSGRRARGTDLRLT